jgi:hypothetical protein
MRPHSSSSLLGPFLLALLFLLPAALPDPVSAQTTVRETGFRREVVRDESLLRAGRWELGLTLSGGWAYSSVTAMDRTVGQSSVYATPSLVAGYMLSDALEVRLALGMLYLRTSAGDAAVQDQLSGAFAVQGLYHLPIVLGMAFYGGIGLGGYYGFQDRPAPGELVRNRFVTSGFLGQLMAGLLVQPGTSLFLRGGLRADLLFGSESAESPALAMQSLFAFNFLLNAELAIGFRF